MAEKVNGTHGGGPIDPIQRQARKAKALRTASHKGGATTKSCREYGGCHHHKHGGHK